MNKSYIPFLAFLILLLLTVPFSFEAATSIVPGWHTIIYPSYFIWGFISLIVFLLISIGFWLLTKRTDKLNWFLFAIHFALTIPTVIFLKFPSFLFDPQMINQIEFEEAIEFRMKLIPIAWTLFIAGQFLFIIYYIRTNKTKPSPTAS